jgi:hypothetical protein
MRPISIDRVPLPSVKTIKQGRNVRGHCIPRRDIGEHTCDRLERSMS